MSTIDEIKSRIDIVDLVSESVQLRRSGKSYTGFCPFHTNTRTPAFVVFPDSGTWRCFGECSEGGDIFSFLMKKEGWDFSETLRYLAEKAGVQLKAPTPEEQAAAEEHQHLRTLLEDAATFYHHNLLNTPAGQEALAYLHQRGLSDEAITAFGLGYAPQSWDAILRYLRGKGYTETHLREAGMVSEREGGGIYDRFRHRITFPIRDERGKMSGFGARILDPNDVPKFLNSPQTPIFDKGRLLYGLDRARKAIRTQDQVVIVEGYLDVIALHQAGFANTVSPMGTALTEHHMRLLKRFTRRIVLALDPDAAGDKATLRGLQIARQALDHTSEPVFDARGLLGHESHLQADIRVTTLPPGMDPDDVVRGDKAEWERILENARPIVIHVMETLASGRDVDDPKVKSEIAAQVLPLVAEVPDPIERDTYRQRLARLIRVDERVLVSSERAAQPARRAASLSQPPRATQAHKAGQLKGRALQEAHCLGVLLRRPDLVFRIDRELQASGLQRLSRSDFQSAEYQSMFALIQESLEQDAAEPMQFVLNGLSLPLMEQADSLLKRTTQLDPSEEKVLEDLLRLLLDIRQSEVRQSMEYLRFLMEDAQQQGDMRLADYQKELNQYTQMLARLHQARNRFTNRAGAKN